MGMRLTVSYDTVTVSFETASVSNETVGIGMKQGDYEGKSHKKCPEEHRAFWKVVMVFGGNCLGHLNE